MIESMNSKFRKATAGRRVFPTDKSLLKCLYMAAMDLGRKWTRIKDWPQIYTQIAILFEDRL
ncbi:transposase [Thermosulfurimonas dismutans]|uniref:transposase n=1 Tax=Thermosulfurimonas dismutans TaxID=999894 RepID=UPI003CC57673